MTDHATNAATPSPLDRRTALAGIAALGAGGLTAAAAARPDIALGVAAASIGLDNHRVGYDPASASYVLPDLPYAYDALEPHIDAETMEIHHSKHHAGYVRGLNRALERLRDIREGTGDVGLVQHWSRQLAFHGSGHVNHTLFWLNMASPSAGGGAFPDGALSERINRDFGSFAQFAAHFKAAAGSVEGSGWAWLAWEPVAHRLIIMQMENQQHADMTGAVPLLGIDVWEHAYYLRYQNRRSAYVDAFMNVVNWGFVAERFEAASH
jgi:Fe-Mn family superoxide dismutase